MELCLVREEGAKGSNEEACIKPGFIKPLPEQKIKTKPKPKPKPTRYCKVFCSRHFGLVCKILHPLW